MSYQEQVKAALEGELKKVNDDIAYINDVAYLAAALQQRKTAVEANLFAVNSMPPDVIEEVGPRLLAITEADVSRLSGLFPPPMGFKPDSWSMSLSSSASGTVVSAITGQFSMGSGSIPDWAVAPLHRFSELAQDQTRRAVLPGWLSKIGPEVGKTFAFAVESVDKARVGTVGVDQAAIRLRDTIERFWGQILEYARSRCPDQRNKLQSSKVLNPDGRRLVAKCLAKPGSELLFTAALDDLNQLRMQLSPDAKNALLTDKNKLEAYYSQWILLFETMSGLVAE